MQSIAGVDMMPSALHARPTDANDSIEHIVFEHAESRAVGFTTILSARQTALLQLSRASARTLQTDKFSAAHNVLRKKGYNYVIMKLTSPEMGKMLQSLKDIELLNSVLD